VSEASAGDRRTRPVVRVLAIWILAALAIAGLGALLPDVHVDSAGAALVAAALIGLLNALLWPLLLRLALPLTVLTLGLGVVIVNGAIVLLVSQVDVGFKVTTLGSAVIVTIGISIVTTAGTTLLAIDDEGFWYRNVVTRHGRRRVPAADPEKPGLLLLEIDGLAHPVLVRAIRDGNVPTLSRWLRDGSHRLARWETDWSSQTGACQAGLLHGDNDDMPAFRWWEKDTGRAIVTNHPRDAAELERRHSNGRGLLFSDGASRANIVSGDAPHSLLTMSTVLRRDRHGRIGQDYFAYFANPYNITRTIVLVIREVGSELLSAAAQRRRDVQPRIKRSFAYSLVRAWATVIQRDLQVSSVIGDMYAGRPVIYTTFLAYDEVAHHSGIERPDALATLRQLDRQIGRIANAARTAARPYRIAVLSDHGQSQGATFRDRYDQTLEQLVEEAVQAGAAAVGGSSSEAVGFMQASVSEAAAGSSMPSRALARVAGERMQEHERAEEPHDPKGREAEGPPEVVVMASGCLGLISFPRRPGRVTLEELEEAYPRLLPSLRGHPGIGFMLVRSERDGAVVIGRDGVNRLERGVVEGTDPLAPFGPNAARHVLRTHGFPHCPDVVVNSTYWENWDEVAAFEELVGSHGGLGGSQSHPFLLHPAELSLPKQELVGAEAVHRELRRWLIQLGHEEYAGQDAPADEPVAG
jgi:uncharacterized membrane protein YvlD (DUF360 family)